MVASFGGRAVADVLPASAIALAPNAFLTVDDVKFTVGAVSCNDGGTTGSPPLACGNLFLASSSGPGADVIIEAADGTVPGVSNLVPIFDCVFGGSSNACISGGTYSLSVTLQAQAVGRHTTITSVAQTLNATGTSNYVVVNHPTDVFSGETVSSGGNALCNLKSNLANLTTVCTPFAAQTTLSLQKNLGLRTNGAQVGNTLALWSISQRLSPAPEPASLATLAAGMAMLGALRRMRKRV